LDLDFEEVRGRKNWEKKIRIGEKLEKEWDLGFHDPQFPIFFFFFSFMVLRF
jgi:hypothetical protein